MPQLPRVLASGVDTLEVYSREPVALAWSERLQEAAKWYAQGGGSKPVAVEVGGPAGQHRFELAGRSRQAPFLLRSEAMAVHVNPWARGSFPQLAIELRSAFLWQHGVREAVHRAQQITAPLLAMSLPALSVSRVDLAVDFQGWSFDLEDVKRFISRGRGRSAFLAADGACSGFTFGTARRAKGEGPAPVLARLYDKSREIREQSPEKTWFYDVWATSPRWHGDEPVWRLEFQLRRKGFRSFVPPPRRCDCADAAGCARCAGSGVLHDSQLDSWGDLERHRRPLWSFLASKWLRIPGQRTGRSRAALDPAWQALADQGFADQAWQGYAGDLTRAGRRKLLQRQAAGFAGRLVSELARAKVHAPAGQPSPYSSPPVTAGNVTAIAVATAERVCAAKGTTLEARAEERAEEHRQKLRDLIAALPPLVPAPPPPPPSMPGDTVYDATPAQPALALDWTVRGTGA